MAPPHVHANTPPRPRTRAHATRGVPTHARRRYDITCCWGVWFCCCGGAGLVCLVCVVASILTEWCLSPTQMPLLGFPTFVYGAGSARCLLCRPRGFVLLRLHLYGQGLLSVPGHGSSTHAPVCCMARILQGMYARVSLGCVSDYSRWSVRMSRVRAIVVRMIVRIWSFIGCGFGSSGFSSIWCW